MNKTNFIKRWGLTLLALTFSLPLWAFPAYTSRENAIRLAEILDKGQFRNFRIASVFVKNRAETEYYVQAILDDGSSQDWRMDQIYEWTLTDQLVLTKNRVLVFPSVRSTNFNVLDKNEFYRLVLTSKAFVKTYGTHDVLEGKNVTYGVRRFRMLQPGENERFKTDPQGNRFRYVLELDNGAREVLTYLDAYKLMNRGAFIQNPMKEDIVLNRSFQVRDLVVIPRKMEDELRNIWRFGVEVFFDQPVRLTPDLIPYQVVEQNMRDPETGIRHNQFFIQIVFPNSEKLREIPGFRTLEYLQHVELITDVEHQQRVFLRAQLAPGIFELPPYIEITDRNSVIVHFFTVTDQSVAHRQQFMNNRVPIEGMETAALTLPKDSEFDAHYVQAVENIRSAQRQSSQHLKIETYLSALDHLHEDSLVANTDQELSQSLMQRDVLLKILPDLIIANAQRRILETAQWEQSAEETQATRATLMTQLRRAGEFAPLRQQRQKIDSLVNILR